MSMVDVFFISVALAADCFAVSVVCGVLLGRVEWRVIVQTCFLFGLFQALMPLVGWAGIRHFQDYVEAYDHWIAFALLSFIGLRMIAGSADDGVQRAFDPRRLSVQLMLAVATSIDALAVGISMSAMGYKKVSDIVVPLTVIGATSFVLAGLGHALGLRYGRSVAHRLRPELAGGLILIVIGLKTLVSHLCA